MQIDQFLSRWCHAGGSERANYQFFIADLCDLLEVDKPHPANVDTRMFDDAMLRARQSDDGRFGASK